MRDRILYQLSDLPWLLAAAAVGLAFEALLLAAGVLRPAAGWVPVVSVAVFYGGALGFVGFRFGRSPVGAAIGAGLGATWALVFALMGWEVWSPAGFWSALVLRTLIGAAVPTLADRLVDPWLLRGPLGRLASHHPRFSHLRR